MKELNRLAIIANELSKLNGVDFPLAQNMLAGEAQQLLQSIEAYFRAFRVNIVPEEARNKLRAYGKSEKIPAIKLTREANGSSLLDAKLAVEEFMKNEFIA